MTLADKIVLLHSGADAEQHGSIAQIGAPLELYHRPASRFVAGFIGSPRMNFLAATVAAIGPAPGGVNVRLEGSGETLPLALDATRVAVGDAVTLGIRPEHLSLTPAPASTAGATGGSAYLEAAAGTLTLTRRVTLVEALGEHSYVHLAQPGGTLIAKAPGDLSLAPGDRVRLAAPAASCHLFAADGFAIAPLAAPGTPDIPAPALIHA